MVDEYIKREKLLIDMHNSHSVPLYIGHMTDEDIMFQQMLDIVKEQPAAEVVSKAVFEQVKLERDTALATLKEHGVVEVRHGYWVRNAPNPEAMRSLHKMGIAKAMSENSIYWTCSCCNEWGHPYDKYCSNCGAKMNGERKAND